MSKTKLEKFYSKMSSIVLLNNVFKGGKGKREASVMAKIVERRFPTPATLKK